MYLDWHRRRFCRLHLQIWTSEQGQHPLPIRLPLVRVETRVVPVLLVTPLWHIVHLSFLCTMMAIAARFLSWSIFLDTFHAICTATTGITITLRAINAEIIHFVSPFLFFFFSLPDIVSQVWKVSPSYHCIGKTHSCINGDERATKVYFP